MKKQNKTSNTILFLPSQKYKVKVETSNLNSPSKYALIKNIKKKLKLLNYKKKEYFDNNKLSDFIASIYNYNSDIMQLYVKIKTKKYKTIDLILKIDIVIFEIINKNKFNIEVYFELCENGYTTSDNIDLLDLFRDNNDNYNNNLKNALSLKNDINYIIFTKINKINKILENLDFTVSIDKEKYLNSFYSYY